MNSIVRTCLGGSRALGLAARLNGDRVLATTVLLGALALGAQVASVIVATGSSTAF
ncbi:hypothetical protein BCF33_0706 [Hasllibacter halocynthiae]|uniref:Uncharacterized protein n=1 Tax=Hasllibacter halocynthiae TaxID=595589 RepID=A0A2T0X837_9RHOB|nr:hypothetical protein [Hasllibacter halocynthiae]PRY95093.1 hypothetical protein BCF33_0706 [Hasllibacter halocynthiae]